MPLGPREKCFRSCCLHGVRSEDNRKWKCIGSSRGRPQSPALGWLSGAPAAFGHSLPSRVPWRWVTRECSGAPGFQSIFSAWRSPPAPPRPSPLPHLLPCPLSPSLPEHLFPRWRRKFTSEPISCVSRSEKQPPDPRYVDRDSRWRELALNKLPWCPHPRKRVQCLQERGQDEARELTRPSCLALLSLLTVRESDAAKGCAIKSSHRKGATLELNVSITSALNTSKQWRQGSVF